ncbi:MAG: maleylpyruvate isomerase N-terminal domain-containing protein [Chloroflexi bacterium]|nr:maleylpyruvate isomerase N-terminal domain-containing protein [Chloroflexota bacterium]
MSEEISVRNLLDKMQNGWDEFQAYLKTLTPEQMTVPTDAQGWTVKDHIAHLALWEDGIAALLTGQSRREQMGLDEAAWNSGDFDIQNAAMQRQHRDKPLDEVLAMFEAAHRRMVEAVQSLTDDDLKRPYAYYEGKPAADDSLDNAIIWSIVGNSYGHYEEHQPWIDAIARGARS